MSCIRRILAACAVLGAVATIDAFGFDAPLLADYPAQVLNTPGLVGHWRFETTTQADGPINGCTGILLGTGAVGAASGAHICSTCPTTAPWSLMASGQAY